MLLYVYCLVLGGFVLVVFGGGFYRKGAKVAHPSATLGVQFDLFFLLVLGGWVDDVRTRKIRAVAVATLGVQFDLFFLLVLGNWVDRLGWFS